MDERELLRRVLIHAFLWASPLQGRHGVTCTVSWREALIEERVEVPAPYRLVELKTLVSRCVGNDGTAYLNALTPWRGGFDRRFWARIVALVNRVNAIHATTQVKVFVREDCRGTELVVSSSVPLCLMRGAEGVGRFLDVHTSLASEVIRHVARRLSGARRALRTAAGGDDRGAPRRRSSLRKKHGGGRPAVTRRHGKEQRRGRHQAARFPAAARPGEDATSPGRTIDPHRAEDLHGFAAGPLSATG